MKTVRSMELGQRFIFRFGSIVYKRNIRWDSDDVLIERADGQIYFLHESCLVVALEDAMHLEHTTMEYITDAPPRFDYEGTTTLKLAEYTHKGRIIRVITVPVENAARQVDRYHSGLFLALSPAEAEHWRANGLIRHQ